MKKPRPKTTWTLEKLKKVAKVYKSRNEMQKDHSGAYKAAMRLKCLNDIFPHCPPQKNIKATLTHKKIYLEAKKYQRKIDFQNNSQVHYRYACEHKILQKVCKHMLPHEIWS